MNDVLGHPITVGCTVLSPSYWSPTMSQLYTVKKVNKKSIILDIDKREYNWDDRSWSEKIVEIRRQPHQMIVVDAQVKHNRKHYPENLV